jgi:hypothetical protein
MALCVVSRFPGLFALHFRHSFRTYAKLFQQGALPQAVRLYGKATQRRWNGFA